MRMSEGIFSEICVCPKLCFPRFKIALCECQKVCFPRFEMVLCVLGFNDTSTIVGHFVSSPRKREKRNRRDSTNRLKRRTGKKEEQEWK